MAETREFTLMFYLASVPRLVLGQLRTLKALRRSGFIPLI